MQAVILAGGKGTRLKPFTASLPKPLVPVGDYPIIEIVLRQLKARGFRDVIVSTGHLAELIEAYCGDGRRWGLNLRYVREEKPLSTAGALKIIRGLKEDFLTVNGDLLTTIDFGALFAAHCKSGAIATLGVCERRTQVDFGVVRLDDRDHLQAYQEKPSYRYLVSMGVNAFDRHVLKHIKEGESLGIPDLVLRVRTAGELVQGYRSKADWLDIGRPEDYQTAQELFASPARRKRYLREDR